jgi:hypothetical protein
MKFVLIHFVYFVLRTHKKKYQKRNRDIWDELETYPASCTMGAVSFPGVKRPGFGVDHPPPSSAEVKGRVELNLYSPFGPSWPVLG